MSHPPFAMSMYLNAESLYKDKANYYFNEYEKLRVALEEIKGLVPAGDINGPRVHALIESALTGAE